MPTLAREFNISLSTVHDYIEEQRKLLRAETIDLAAQERDQALQLIDNAIEQVVPHINGEVLVQPRGEARTRARHGCPGQSGGITCSGGDEPIRYCDLTLGG